MPMPFGKLAAWTEPATSSIPRPEKPDWRLARYAVVVGIATIGFPQTVAKYPWNLPVPIQNAGAIMIVLVGFGSLLSGRVAVLGALSARVAMFLAVILYSVILGAIQYSHANFVGRFFVRELLFLAMCTAGIAIAMTWRGDRLNRLLENVNVTSSVLLLLFSVLLQIGLIGDTQVGQDRLLDISLYVYTVSILVTTPLVVRNSSRPVRHVVLSVAFSTASTLLFSLTSATRSSLLQLIVMLAVVLVIAIKRYRLKLKVVVQLCGSVGLLLVAVLYFSDTTVLAQRLGSTYVRDEIRFVELNDILRQRDMWFPLGAGIGVGFETAIGYETSEDRFGGLVNSSHIGVISWTLKAGVIGMLLSISILIRAFAWLGEARVEIQTRANFDSGLLVLTAIGSSSGGWTMLDLFFTGLCFARGSVALRPGFLWMRPRAPTRLLQHAPVSR